MQSLSYEWRKRITWAVIALMFRVVTYAFGGYPWELGPVLGTWATWTCVLIVLALTHPFERRRQQLQNPPYKRRSGDF